MKPICPYCQAAVDGPAVFCGNCGRRVASWQEPSPPPATDAAPTRPAVDRSARVDDPAATMLVPPREEPVDDELSPSMMGVVRPQGPRLLKMTALVLALAIAAAGLVATAVKHLASSPPPPVVVNLDQPVARYDVPDVPLGKRVRRRHGARPSGAAAVGAAVAAPAARAAPTIDAPPAVAPTGAPAAAAPVRAAPVQRPADPPAAAPAAIETSGTLDGEEEEPPSPEELAEAERARGFADGIRFVLRAHRTQVVSCYERAFKGEQRSPGGRVTVDFTVGADGRTKGVHASVNSTGNEMLGRCLEQLITGWEFPKPPDGDFPTSYPFVFSAGT